MVLKQPCTYKGINHDELSDEGSMQRVKNESNQLQWNPSKTPEESVLVSLFLTLGAHARGLRYLSCVCVCVCVSVYPSVPALAASASVETSKQRYSRVSLRLFFD